MNPKEGKWDIEGGYARIYLKRTILKNYMHHARAPYHARARAAREGRWDESTT
jgi:hypothetical protein